MQMRRAISGWFLVLLALASLLAAGATVPQAVVQAAEPLAGFAIICHSDSGLPQIPQPHHSAPDCQACVICAALATPAPMLGDGPFVPPPVVALLPAVALPPPSTAPPVVVSLAARPRGPPSLV
jgi:hypothetical protein